MIKNRVFTTDDCGAGESTPRLGEDGVSEVLASAFLVDIPESLRSVEENTVPSWLWRRRGIGAATKRETQAAQIFDRVAGSAAYAGWKQGLFNDEGAARIFHDEIRFLLGRRMIALESTALATLGGDWAYGLATVAAKGRAAAKAGSASLGNATLDAILSGDAALATRWKNLLNSGKGGDQVVVTLSDTVGEWSAAHAEGAPRLMLDLLQFLREDGAIDIVALRQATRLATILLELHYDRLAAAPSARRALAFGYGNLAGLLMALAIPYDSEAGRATAAALSAIITAEATATSAELAATLGVCAGYAAEHDSALRALRNRRRAAYGERNDYERVSILPTPLTIESGADLVLVATARRRWDEAVEAAQRHGLRHLQLTTLFAAQDFAAQLDCSAQGIAPERSLTRLGGVHPAVPLGLARLGCDPADVKAIIDHVLGYRTLVAAPGINHSQLRAVGFDAAALARVEAQLPRVTHIRHAFTPWIVGEKLCREAFGLKDKHFDDYAFDLLRHLKFSAEAIAAANAFCCGHGSPLGAMELPAAGAKLFAAAQEVVAMAAAVQPFIAGDVGLAVTLPESATTEARAAILLAAWRAGVKSVALNFEHSGAAPVRLVAAREKILKRATPKLAAPVPVIGQKLTTSRMVSPRAAKPKAATATLLLKRGKPKTRTGVKGH